MKAHCEWSEIGAVQVENRDSGSAQRAARVTETSLSAERIF